MRPRLLLEELSAFITVLHKVSCKTQGEVRIGGLASISEILPGDKSLCSVQWNHDVG